MVNEKKTTMHIYSFSWKVRLLLLGFPLLGIAWTVFGLITFLPSWHTYWGRFSWHNLIWPHLFYRAELHVPFPGIQQTYRDRRWHNISYPGISNVYSLAEY